jgi:asparagine synthase (glutamine-hydrolysing)
MCGIAGFLQLPWGRDILQQMTNGLAHRGPDAEGHLFDPSLQLGLGHRRLSILDLSSAANQPFFSASGQCAIVFNGEVYNFREVAAALQAEIPGFQLKTTGDTEVLVEAFEHWGPAFIHRCNGMFAIAIFDYRNHRLYLFRDRLGIKPLYCHHAENGVAFCSEIRALANALRAAGTKLSLHHNAMALYLQLGYVPGNATIWQEIGHFPTGHYGIYSGKNWEWVPYWQPKDQVLPESAVIRQEVEAKQRLSALLWQSVSRRMVSDVPLGTFLSGGTDSSVVTALASKMASGRLKTFSIGFKESKFDERDYAAKVAAHLGTDHHPFELSYQDALERVSLLPNIYGQPYADSSAIPTLLVSEMARKHVTVALSGDGGDELFLGYGMYQWAGKLANPLLQGLSPIVYRLLAMGRSREKRVAELLQLPGEKAKLPLHLFSQEQYLFSEAELPGLLAFQPSQQTQLPAIYALARQLEPAEAQAFFDLNYYLKDDLLVKVDIASMQHALEVRVPLLDYEVVSFALNLHPSLKKRGDISKYLLKEVLYDHVPRQLFDRPKWGFAIPLSHWLTHELGWLIDQYLSKEALESTGIFHPESVRRYIMRFRKGENYLYNRLWCLIVLQKWLIDHGK